MTQDLLEQLCIGLSQEFTKLENTGDSHKWTSAVFAALLAQKEEISKLYDISVDQIFEYYDRNKGGSGEFMVDFMYCNFPTTQEPNQNLEVTNEQIFLAVESEWGNQGSPRLNFKEVLKDFRKLTNIKAKIKVMIYGCHISPKKKIHAIDLENEMKSILQRTSHFRDDEVYLLFGTPWDILCPWNPRISTVEVARGIVTITEPEWAQNILVQENC